MIKSERNIFFTFYSQYLYNLHLDSATDQEPEQLQKKYPVCKGIPGISIIQSAD